MTGRNQMYDDFENDIRNKVDELFDDDRKPRPEEYRFTTSAVNGNLFSNSSYAESDVAIIGVPYDSTTSFRPGARFAPSSIRMNSFGIESFSPYQNRDLSEVKVFDVGDIELPLGLQERAVELVESWTRKIMSDGKFPIILGGEHLMSLGAIKAAAKKYGTLYVIQFDAHADLRNDYLGNPLSHACVMRRVHEILGDGKIFQYGIRSGTREEFDFIREGRVASELFTADNVSNLRIPEGAPVYVTVDMDVLDPSEFPGTGTPEAGGLKFMQLLSSVKMILYRFNVVGLDNMELSPMLDPTGRSTALSCKLLREEILALKLVKNNH